MENRTYNQGRSKSRAVGCWNCGLFNHVSKECTAPRASRCALCRRRGVTTYACHCKKRGGHKQESREKCDNNKTRFSEPVEPATLVIVHQKHVKAVVNTNSQESRMGRKVYALVQEKQTVNPKKKLIKTAYGIELVRTVVMNIGVRSSQKYPLEIVIDEKIPENEMSLGMMALRTLGYRITISGRETRERPAWKRLRKISSRSDRQRASRDTQQDRERADSDDDKISFLDEAEAKRIREWEY